MSISEKISYHVNYMITPCCEVYFCYNWINSYKNLFTTFCLSIQNIICSNSLQNYRLLDFFADFKFRSAVHCLTIPSFTRHQYVVSGSFVCQSSEFFLLEAVRDTLVSYAWRDVVLPDTRVVTPQLREDLCTLPVVVRFTRGLTHVLTFSLNN